MKILKKALFFSLGLLIFLTVIRRFYRVMALQVSSVSAYIGYNSNAHEEQNSQAKDEAATSGVHYNFSRLVRLMESCNTIKRTFYQNFTPYFAHKQEIDMDELKHLLKQLHQEKVRFQHYIWELKGYSREAMPARQQRALKYYFHIIEKSIVDLEKIQHKYSNR
jgi:hypothetical protein